MTTNRDYSLTMRVTQEERFAATRMAEEYGVGISDVVRAALKRFLDDPYAAGLLQAEAAAASQRGLTDEERRQRRARRDENVAEHLVALVDRVEGKYRP